MKLSDITYLFPLLVFFLMTNTCSILKNELNSDQVNNTETRYDQKKYDGWWIYGEGHHVFKDKLSLEEWELVFLNEDRKQIKELYLSISKMEYFPIEIIIIGTTKLDKISGNSYLNVLDFDITYVEGCGD